MIVPVRDIGGCLCETMRRVSGRAETLDDEMAYGVELDVGGRAGGARFMVRSDDQRRAM